MMMITMMIITMTMIVILFRLHRIKFALALSSQPITVGAGHAAAPTVTSSSFGHDGAGHKPQANRKMSTSWIILLHASERIPKEISE